MKIRSGYVSNSSSTSFVVCLPPDDDMELWRKDVRKVMKSMKDSDPEIEFDVSEDYMMERIESLQNGEHLYENGEETKEWSIYFELFKPWSDDVGIRGERLLVKNVETEPFSGNVINICAKGNEKKLSRICKL